MDVHGKTHTGSSILRGNPSIYRLVDCGSFRRSIRVLKDESSSSSCSAADDGTEEMAGEGSVAYTVPGILCTCFENEGWRLRYFRKDSMHWAALSTDSYLQRSQSACCSESSSYKREAICHDEQKKTHICGHLQYKSVS